MLTHEYKPFRYEFTGQNAPRCAVPAHVWSWGSQDWSAFQMTSDNPEYRNGFLPAEIFAKLTGERWHSGFAYATEQEAMEDLKRAVHNRRG